MGSDGVVRWRYVSLMSSFYVISLYFLGHANNKLVRHLCMTDTRNGGTAFFVAFFHLDVDTLGLYSSEGIQVGNVGSAAGIIGAWTGATHDSGSCSPLITLI
jgi:hypothetical protein